MNARWRKVIGDLRESRGRTLAVGLAVWVGCTMMSAALGAKAVLEREVESSFRGAHPPSATLWLDDVPGALVEAVRAQPGVAEAEPRRLIRARAEVAPGEWRPLRIFVVDDFSAMRIATFTPAGGSWPPRDGELLVERSALPVLRTQVGATLRVRAPGGATAELPVVGLAHDPAQAPGWMDHLGYAYATRGTLTRLGQGPQLDELMLTTTATDRVARGETAAALATWLKDQGHEVHRVEVTRMTHPHTDHMGTMLLVLQLFSAVALVLSGALAANVIAATMARQVRQIGVLKAIGATTRQIAGIYLTVTLLPSLVAVALALPLGAVAARAFATFAAEHLNLVVIDASIPLAVIALQLGLGLGVPLVAAAVPVIRVARTPVRVALQDLGAATPAPARGRDAPWGPTWRLVLRNAARRPVRAGLTLAALALGGAILVTAGNTYASLQRALATALAARGEDIAVRLAKPAPAEAVVATVRAVPGVRDVEAWASTRISLELARGAETGRYTLFAPPSDSTLFRPRLVAGRWPGPGEAAVVVNRVLQDSEDGLGLGARIGVLAGRRRAQAEVVGVIEEVGEPALYTSPQAFPGLGGAAGTAGDLRVVTEDDRAHAVAAALEERLLDAGMFPLDVMTHDNYGRALADHFVIILICLSVIAGASIVVGALGLSTSMSLSTLERTREIGVLRAIGATRRVVFRIVLCEGLAIAGASVVVAVALALPATAGVCRAVGSFGLHAAVPVVFSPLALVAWIGLAGIVGVAASVGPARAALRPPVREVLMHE